MSAVEFPEITGRPFAADAPDIEGEGGQVVPASAELVPAGDVVEWTPERAATLVRGFGLALHTLDPATRLDGGRELWRATSQEAADIGAPLSRILARYEPARRLAGVVDEAELGAAFVSYAKRNMQMRGRAVLLAKHDAAEEFGGESD